MAERLKNSKKSTALATRLVATALFLFTTLAVADDSWKEWSAGSWRTSIDGFGTLGLTLSDDEGFGFRRDISQNDAVFAGDVAHSTDSLFGLQTSVQYDDWFMALVQGKTKASHKGYEYYINLALLQFQYSPAVIFRVGRLPQDIYPFSESRDVAFSYLWVRPSVEFYGPLLLEHFDGVDWAYT